MTTWVCDMTIQRIAVTLQNYRLCVVTGLFKSDHAGIQTQVATLVVLPKFTFTTFHFNFSLQGHCNLLYELDLCTIYIRTFKKNI